MIELIEIRYLFENYMKVADLPYDTHCLSSLANDREEVNVKSIERCR